MTETKTEAERVLRRKAEEFDANRKRSRDNVIKSIKHIRERLDDVESDLLREIDREFGENLFGNVLCDLGSLSSVQLEEILKLSVQALVGPSDSDFFNVTKAISGLRDWRHSQTKLPAPQNVVGYAPSSDSISVT